MKIDIIITRHPALVAYLQEKGLADEATPIIEHASISDVKGKHVLGVLPHHLSQHCASITEVPMQLTKEDREAMQAGDLTLERVREVAGPPVTYQVFGGVESQRRGDITRQVHRPWEPCAHTLRCLIGLAKSKDKGDDIWDHNWASCKAHRSTAAQWAARASIPWGLMGPDIDAEANSGLLDYRTACGRSAAEADLLSGAFRVYASGPGWSAWIDAREGRILDVEEVKAWGLDLTKYENQPGGYPDGYDH